MPWEFVCGQTLASALSFGAADDAAKMGAEKADSKPGLRHVERVVRTYGRECGYDTPVQEVHIVQHPVPDKDGKGRPLYVVLHSAGHDADKAFDCALMPDNHDIYSAPDDFYGLYLDCRMAKDSDWWWGANKRPGFALSPCERRLLATIEETVVLVGVWRQNGCCHHWRGRASDGSRT